MSFRTLLAVILTLAVLAGACGSTSEQVSPDLSDRRADSLEDDVFTVQDTVDDEVTIAEGVRRLSPPISAPPVDGPTGAQALPQPTAAAATPTPAPAATRAQATPDFTPPSPLALLARPIESAQVGVPEVPSQPVPVGLSIESVDVEAAPVIPTGVDSIGDFEVPPADEVGWYRFGPSPGADTGSAVLAAHIAFDGVDGVFRHLADAKPGERVEVTYDDGSTVAFMIDEITEYVKTALPVDDLFAKDGDARLVLITCGGDFNRSLNSYDSNVVVTATRVP